MYKEEAPISPAGTEHSKTSGRNYKLGKVKSEAFQQRAACLLIEGLSFFVFKGFKTFTTLNIPSQIKPRQRRNRGERETNPLAVCTFQDDSCYRTFIVLVHYVNNPAFEKLKTKKGPLL